MERLPIGPPQPSNWVIRYTIRLVVRLLQLLTNSNDCQRSKNDSRNQRLYVLSEARRYNNSRIIVNYRGFLHGHVSYISEDCQACLLLLTVQRDAFFPLSQAKHTIAEKLRRSNCLVAINDALHRNEELPTTNPLKHIGIPEIRHFMYKCKSTAQLFTSDPISLDKLQDYRIRHKEGGDIMVKKVEKLSDIDYVRNYRSFCSSIHCTSTPAKLIFRSNSTDTILAWVTNGFELYVTFDPLMEKDQAIKAVDRLLKWIKKEEQRIFIMHAPTF